MNIEITLTNNGAIYQLMMTESQFNFLDWLEKEYLIDDKNFTYRTIDKITDEDFVDLTELVSDKDKKKVVIITNDNITTYLDYYYFNSSQIAFLYWLYENPTEIDFLFKVITEKPQYINVSKYKK